MNEPCETCMRRGWSLPSPNDWPVKCPTCGGRGAFTSIAQIARRIDYNADALRRLARGAPGCGPKRAYEILTRLSAVFGAT